MSEFDGYRESYHKEIEAAISYAGQSHDYYTKVKGEYLLELLDAELPGREPLNVLDVGCGHGDIHPFVTSGERKLKLTGIDVAASVVEDARAARNDVVYDVYDGERLPYDDNSFDAAYTVCVMHHVPPAQWSAFVAEMGRVVRPGGVIAIFEHNPLNPLTRRLVNTCPLDENAVLLNSGELTGLARQAGLDRVRARFIIFTPFDKPLFKRFDRLMGWLPLGAQYYVVARTPMA